MGFFARLMASLGMSKEKVREVQEDAHESWRRLMARGACPRRTTLQRVPTRVAFFAFARAAGDGPRSLNPAVHQHVSS
jgi:hypothetical protein